MFAVAKAYHGLKLLSSCQLMQNCQYFQSTIASSHNFEFCK